MKLYKVKKVFLCCVLLSLSLTSTSCDFSNHFIVVEPITYNVIAQKGSASLSLGAYYDDDDLELSDDIKKIEEAFKGTGEPDDYQIIVYDSVRGLDLCEEYGNYAYIGTLAMGNQQFVPLKDKIDNTKKIKVLLNNEQGSLGKTFKKISELSDQFEIEFTSLNELEYYNYFLNGEYKTSDYDYAFITEPYATRLMTIKESPLYNQIYDEYTANTDRGFDTSKKMYCASLRDSYRSFNTSKFNDRGIPQTGFFVNKNFYSTHYETMNKVFDMINKEVELKYVRDVSYTRVDFRKLSEEYNDPNEDPNSEQTQLAFKVQFDKVGISYSEVARLQAWHVVLGQDAPYEKFINRLEYVKDIYTYYSDDYLKAYYEFIGETFPSEENFIKINKK